LTPGGIFGDYSSIQHLEKKNKYIYWIHESNNFICGNTSKLPVLQVHVGVAGIVIIARSDGAAPISRRAWRLTVAFRGEAVTRAANIVWALVEAHSRTRSVQEAHPVKYAAQVAATGATRPNWRHLCKHEKAARQEGH
jgi:hypothetical protein